MATDNPKISAYVPQPVYNRFKKFQEEQNLSMSQTLSVILVQFFGMEAVMRGWEEDNEMVIGGVTLERMEKLEKQVQQVTELVDKLLMENDTPF